MRSKLALVMVLALAMASVASFTSGCSKGEKVTEILIGNIQDLTGPNKAFGIAMTNAATMLAEKINAQGGINGKQIRIISYDTKSEVPEAINAYNRLVDQDNVLACLGPPIANMGIALAPVAEEKKVVIAGLFMDERGTTKQEGVVWKYMFLGQNSCGAQARIIARYAIEQLGCKTFALLYNQANAYSVSLAAPFAQYVMSHGGSVVATETFQTGEQDYRTQLTKVRNLKPDAIYMPLYPQEIPLGLKQAHELGIESIILGDNSYIPFAAMAGAEASEGVYFPYGIDPSDPKLQEFKTEYTAKFGIDPIAQSYSGYDIALALVKAIERAGKAGNLNREAIAQEMEKTENLEGCFQGLLTISPLTHRPVSLPMFILQMQNNVPVTITSLTEQ